MSSDTFVVPAAFAGGILYSLFWPLQFQVAQVLLLNVSEMLLQNE